MRPSLLCITITPVAFILLCAIRPSLSQMIGCDDPDMDCPNKATDADSGLCSLEKSDFGAMSFQSNITSDGPLTWTVAAGDGKGNGVYPDYSTRTFYLGTPPLLDLSRITDFGACSTVSWNFTSLLQLSSDSSDPDDYGCSSVIGDQCAQDVLDQVRNVLLSLLDSDFNDTSRAYPCLEVQDRISISGPPTSCQQVFNGARYLYGQSQSKPIEPGPLSNVDLQILTVLQIALTNNTELLPTPQEGCSITPGGSSYDMYSAGTEDTRILFDYNERPKVKPSKEYIEGFKTGSTPILTLFYNEPWNAASTGPVPFLNGPEVHLSCVRTVPREDQESGSSRAQSSLSTSSMALVLTGTLVWLSIAF